MIRKKKLGLLWGESYFYAYWFCRFWLLPRFFLGLLWLLETNKYLSVGGILGREGK